MRKTEEIDELERMAKSLATCTYEHNTLWGIEVSIPEQIPGNCRIAEFSSFHVRILLNLSC